ncbi:MAG: hypothetical protein HYT62_01680 [Candidatus Yanofskybacteria bacterium]|nr:hypothetical protein [Candidatus Yanofskybacteria bacterium]
MADRTLTKKDVLTFLNLGRKIAVSGAGAVLDTAKSKIADLIDSDEALQRRVEAQVQALLRAGFTELEARKAVFDRMRTRIDNAFQKSANPIGDNIVKK